MQQAIDKKLLFNNNGADHNRGFDPGYDEVFYDDALELFLETNAGHLGKYIYDFSGPQKDDIPLSQTDTWNEIVLHSKEHYIPRADRELFETAGQYLKTCVPSDIPYIDFGAGSDETIRNLTLPVIKLLKSKRYYAIDYCEKYLAIARELKSAFGSCVIDTVHADFFYPPEFPIETGPAFGVMTGCTIGNIYGSMRDLNVNLNLARTLKDLMRFMPQGQLAISVDTNQDEGALFKNYMTPLHRHLFLSSMFRIKALLPTNNFDPELFEYAPEWHPDLQLFAHIAKATETQEFELGDKYLHVKKGQKLHLLNSYKFGVDFFETCCAQAGLSVVNRWDHETSVKLYLLQSEKQA
ncbi:MAG: L-histidine N(alpha)-methyltransferase [Alphaproteobacteria bacterium]|nr:L-histidine N(alpha)-methyltransferase [Alphaproteobacteria bacterium]